MVRLAVSVSLWFGVIIKVEASERLDEMDQGGEDKCADVGSNEIKDQTKLVHMIEYPVEAQVKDGKLADKRTN